MTLTDYSHDKRAERESRGGAKLAIMIDGPGRGFDFALFCVDHNTDAEECASEWIAEVIDCLEDGTLAVQVTVRKWRDGDVCCACEQAKGDDQ
jgi:hypothetical protein